MIGAIIGDIVGSRFEFNNHRSKDFELFAEDCFFTDDTTCIIATMRWLNASRNPLPVEYASILRAACAEYPEHSYGGMFGQWLKTRSSGPYNSFGNGSAMRVPPVGWLAQSLPEALELAKSSAVVTHDHEEGIKGAQATAWAINLARDRYNKTAIKRIIEDKFGYNLGFTCDQIRDTYEFNETCQETVPQAIVAFLDGHDFEDCIRNAISVGGDSDTLAAITGAIAEAYYGVPVDLVLRALDYLPGSYALTIQSFYKYERRRKAEQIPAV